jgi:diaminohydroxyphosphoribosylaminopyrimidine deaminase/5-amino-6-(5-phosphoribosylamino)uracil reductase
MLEALRLSRNGLGRTAPNPMVGALLVREGQILARGWHTAYGEKHAERAALDEARKKGVDPSTCTLVVTLEPCVHHGHTPPCAEAVLEAGIRHVVVGAPDPNPVAAGGARRLAEAGVKVEFGAAPQECLDNIADFLLFQHGHRPYVLLKLAASLDGRIADRHGRSRGLSSPESLAYVHWLRSRVQAVLIGGNTFYMDNPKLTARLGHESDGAQPLAVVVGGRLPDADSSFYLLRERPGSTIFFTGKKEAAGGRGTALRGLGLRIHGLEEEKNDMSGGLCLEQCLDILRREYNCFYVLCEGGGRLGLSLLRQGLADEFLLHMAPRVLGDSLARPLFDGAGAQSLEQSLNLRFISGERRGPDLCLRYMSR